MAKYTVECSGCGNEMTIELFGNMKKREWIIENGDHVCDDCFKKEREEQNKAKAEENRRMGLPELRGSEKQVSWAESIRSEFVEGGVAKYGQSSLDFRRSAFEFLEKNGISGADINKVKSTAIGMIEDAFDEMKSNDDSRFWIINRTNLYKPFGIVWAEMVVDLLK